MTAGEQEETQEQKSESTQAIIAVYTALYSRYQGNIDLQWKLPALVLTAQSFLISASVQSFGRPLASAALSILIAGIGAVSLGIMRRVELLAFLDRPMLDHYERILLQGTRAPLLQHGAKIKHLRGEF
jgi:hypothetical protein